MSDLIHKGELFNALANAHDKGEIFAIIHDMQTVDAAEVVRCRECKHWGKHDDVYVPGETDKVKACECAFWMVGENGYCVYGERRNDESIT